MKIYSQTIASGREWQPCIHCQKRFEFGEIITAIENDTGNRVDYWYCSGCFEQYWFSPLPAPVERDDDGFCMIFLKDNKVCTPPKIMEPADYMKRKSRMEISTVRKR